MTLLEKTVVTALLVASAAWISGAAWAQEQDVRAPGAEATWQLCSACHGADGSGNQQFFAPAIAGLPQWYVEAQLKKFKAGHRGTHPADSTGLRMYPMTRYLRSEEQLEAVAQYVSELPRTNPAPVLEGGDAARGKALFAPCSACHGANALGNQAMNAPPLAGSSDWYLLTQLKHFKAHIRGGNPKDATGMQMAGMANLLPNEAAMKDVIAHIMTLTE